MAKHLTAAEARAIRSEYISNPLATYEYLADKYDRETTTISNILNNKTHYDPNYINPRKRENAGIKKAVYLPKHILEAKDELTPAPQTLHRARGHNKTINRFT